MMEGFQSPFTKQDTPKLKPLFYKRGGIEMHDSFPSENKNPESREPSWCTNKSAFSFQRVNGRTELVPASIFYAFSLHSHKTLVDMGITQSK